MDTIRTAVIGFGVAGRIFHAPLVTAEQRFTFSAIVTGSPDRAAAARKEYPETEVLSHVDELFARADEFDLVVIGSPNVTHAPLAERAIDAGLYIVIDKPVAVTSAAARDVAERAASAGIVMTVFQNRRWDGDFLTLVDVVQSGELGDIQQFESAFEWWNPTLGDGWKDTTAPGDGGGITYDLAPHLVDQALRLFGEVGTAHAELDRRRAGAQSDDDSFVSLRHDSGVRTRLWMSAVSRSPRPRFRVVGSAGVFLSEGLDPQEAQLIAGRRPGEPGFGLHDDGRTATITGPDGARDIRLRAGDHLEFYRRLGDAILSDAAVPVDPADSIRALEIIEDIVDNNVTL